MPRLLFCALLVVACAHQEVAAGVTARVGLDAPAVPASSAVQMVPKVAMTGEFGEFSGKLWAIEIALLAAQKPPEILVVINSPGGSVAEGFRVIGAMRAAQANGVAIRCLVDGEAASMAAILLESGACTTRSMTKGSALMFHEIYNSAMPAGRLTRQFIQDQANQIEDVNHEIAVLIAWRMKLTAPKYLAWISGHNRYVDAGEALELGFVDSVD